MNLGKGSLTKPWIALASAFSHDSLDWIEGRIVEMQKK
jgi:hypothetical protein